MIKMLHEKGATPEMAYTAGFASIALTLATWTMSKKLERAGIDRADRWGLFTGEWAPTFFAIGLALQAEEKKAKKA
ncbi:MAG: hypothetical protein M0026_17220 [Nocardiopsaceae bacterium]|nr:hypothetical protein [Nocardiopsaceae bacterium]